MNANLYYQDLIDEELNEKEIYRSLCGEDELGNPNAVVSVKVSDFDLESQTETVQDEIVLDSPVVSVFRTPDFTTVDLTFSNVNDFDFINTASRLQDYVEQAEERIEDPKVFSTIVLTLYPISHPGVYCTGIHGTYSCVALKPGELARTLRFTFRNDSVFVFQMEENGEEETDTDTEQLIEDGGEEEADIWGNNFPFY